MKRFWEIGFPQSTFKIKMLFERYLIENPERLND